MSLKVLSDCDDSSCIYDAMYEKVFGTIIHGQKDLSSEEVATEFVKWLEYYSWDNLVDLDFHRYFSDFVNQLNSGTWPLRETEYD